MCWHNTRFQELQRPTLLSDLIQYTSSHGGACAGAVLVAKPLMLFRARGAGPFPPGVMLLVQLHKEVSNWGGFEEDLIAEGG